MRKRASWWFLQVLTPVTTFAFMGSLLYNVRDSVRLIEGTSFAKLGLLLGLTAATYFLNSSEFAVLYRGMGVQIGFLENWLLYSAGQAGNYAPGQVGTLYRFRYLDEIHHLAIGRATAVHAMNLTISLGATGTAGLFGVVGLAGATSKPSYALTALFLAMVAFALVILLRPAPVRNETRRFRRLIQALAQGWNEVRLYRREAQVVYALEIVKYCISAWRLAIIFSWIGINQPFLVYFIIAPVAALVTFVSITPAGIGAREAAITGTALALGVQLNGGLLGSTIDRLVHIMVVAACSVPGFYFTTRALRKALPT